MSTTEKVKYVCSHCGSSNVETEAYAQWDIETQQWLVSEIREDGGHTDYCITCGENHVVEEAPVDLKDLAKLAIERFMK